MRDLTAAVAHLHAGGVVAFPTDTFYGLAVDPWSAVAVATLFDCKGRDARMAVPLIAASLQQVTERFGLLPPRTGRLAMAFWPGPLSLIVDAPSTMAAAVHGGGETVAVRVPDHEVARAFAAAAGRPITATSANRSGAPPARTLQEIGDLLRDPRVLAIDDGPTPGGAPSTIVDVRGDAPRLVREGAIAWARVLDFLQE